MMKLRDGKDEKQPIEKDYIWSLLLSLLQLLLWPMIIMLTIIINY